jgi:hypothetical protein
MLTKEHPIPERHNAFCQMKRKFLERLSPNLGKNGVTSFA